MKTIAKSKIIAELENGKSKARSAWKKGVFSYAIDLIEEIAPLPSMKNLLPADREALERYLLNGASDWDQYSWNGCALIYDEDIATTLCTPSELKKTKNGQRRPNAREEWLDVQGRALHQAFCKIWASVYNCERVEK